MRTHEKMAQTDWHFINSLFAIDLNDRKNFVFHLHWILNLIAFSFDSIFASKQIKYSRLTNYMTTRECCVFNCKIILSQCQSNFCSSNSHSMEVECDGGNGNTNEIIALRLNTIPVQLLPFWMSSLVSSWELFLFSFLCSYRRQCELVLFIDSVTICSILWTIDCMRLLAIILTFSVAQISYFFPAQVRQFRMTFTCLFGENYSKKKKPTSFIWRNRRMTHQFNNIFSSFIFVLLFLLFFLLCHIKMRSNRSPFDLKLLSNASNEQKKNTLIDFQIRSPVSISNRK